MQSPTCGDQQCNHGKRLDDRRSGQLMQGKEPHGLGFRAGEFLKGFRDTCHAFFRGQRAHRVNAQRILEREGQCFGLIFHCEATIRPGGEDASLNTEDPPERLGGVRVHKRKDADFGGLVSPVQERSQGGRFPPCLLPVRPCKTVLKFEHDDAVIGIGETVSFGDDFRLAALFGETPCQARYAGLSIDDYTAHHHTFSALSSSMVTTSRVFEKSASRLVLRTPRELPRFWVDCSKPAKTNVCPIFILLRCANERVLTCGSWT